MQQDTQQTVNMDVCFLIIGGGIAGVTCAETLAICCPQNTILLMTESNIIKAVTNLQPVARYLFKFDVHEYSINNQDDNILATTVSTLIDKLEYINANDRYVLTKSGKKIAYQYLCLCTGGRPRLISKENPLVLGIRDTDSVLELQERLKSSKCLVVVGNGGIASELVYALKGVEVHWVVKDNYITSTFLDPGSAHFFQEFLEHRRKRDFTNFPKVKGAVKRMRYNEMFSSNVSKTKQGAALGPDWQHCFEFQGAGPSGKNQGNIIMHYQAQVLQIYNLQDGENSSVKVTLTTGEEIICDLVISATGVNPQLNFTCEPSLDLDMEDGGIKVNDMMQTSTPHIYAAGDVCTAAWPMAENWFQMRLWTQARQMGAMAGRSMAAAFQHETIYQDFCFELFGHVTELYGFPLVLLGQYNGQNLNNDYEILLRSSPGHEYIKFVLQNGRLRGAALIGNTELAETCENLILNAIDLTPFGDDILNPDIDIEDYFD